MRWIVLTALLGACQKQASETPEYGGPVHPELVCEEGAITGGKIPPVGFEAWCHRPTPEGRWYREGPSISWHPNGQKAAQGLYEGGKRNGEWTLWFANGNVQKRLTYQFGAEEGLMLEYHPDGAKAAEGMMAAGLATGAWQYWSADGTVRTEGQWKAGKQDGEWVAYDTVTEKPIKVTVYRGGRMTTSKALTESL